MKYIVCSIVVSAKEKNKAKKGGGQCGREDLTRQVALSKVYEGGRLWIPEVEHSKQRDQQVLKALGESMPGAGESRAGEIWGMGLVQCCAQVIGKNQ